MASISSILRQTEPAAAEPERDAVAVRAFFRLVELWGLSMEQARVLLGRPSRATLYNWKAGRARSLPHDTLRRISYLLGIYKALQILYQDPALADAWVTRPNEAFGGQSATRAHAGGRRHRSRRGPRPSRCRPRRLDVRRVGNAAGAARPLAGRASDPAVALSRRSSCSSGWPTIRARGRRLAEIESLTNPRLRDEIGEIRLVPVEERVSGPGASWVMASFTHLNPKGSRFSDGSYGVYYAARELETAIAETTFHLGRFYAATADPPHAEDMRVLSGRVDTRFHDLRGGDPRWRACLDPEDYAASRALGRQPARRRQQRHRLAECPPDGRPMPRRLPAEGGRHPGPGPASSVPLGRPADQPLLRLCRGAVDQPAATRLRRSKPASRSAIRSSGSSSPAWIRMLGKRASQAVAVR